MKTMTTTASTIEIPTLPKRESAPLECGGVGTAGSSMTLDLNYNARPQGGVHGLESLARQQSGQHRQRDRPLVQRAVVKIVQAVPGAFRLLHQIAHPQPVAPTDEI